jgi:hypothetical protein
MNPQRLLPICFPIGYERQFQTKIAKGRSGFDLRVPGGGRYWDRTSDLFGVNEARPCHGRARAAIFPSQAAGPSSRRILVDSPPVAPTA